MSDCLGDHGVVDVAYTFSALVLVRAYCLCGYQSANTSDEAAARSSVDGHIDAACGTTGFASR